MSDDMRDMLHDAATRIFADHPSDLWTVLQEAGFDRALLPEEKGGAGLSWADAYGLLAIAGGHAAAVPLAEALIGQWLADRAGVVEAALPVAAVSHGQSVRLHRAGDGWRVSGSLPRVPWGRTCTHLVVIVGSSPDARIVVLERAASGITLSQGENIAAEPRDSVVLEDIEPLAVAPAPFDSEALLVVAAIARSALMAGAIDRTLALAVEYANMRVQFGRPIGKFQAIQQSIAVLATQAAAARTSAEAGSEAIDAWLAGAGEDLAGSITALSAKIRTGEAAGQACAIAHQVFGAIGFTEEHELHRFTKRLWSWREEYGNEAFWSLALGERVLDVADKQTLWRTVAAPQVGLVTEVAR